jgi:TRAP-type C4-dicarboxylate transport system permease small subunit
MLKRAYEGLQTGIRWALCLLMILMVVIVFANVVARYYLSASLAWSEEVARFMLIWLVFLGAVLAYVNDEHLGLDIVVQLFPRRIRYGLAVVADLLVMVAIYLLIHGGAMLMRDSWEWGSPATDTPYGYVYAVVPACGTLLFLGEGV